MPTQEQFIDDPFSLDFMKKVDKQMEILHVSAASLPRKRIKQDKFVIHPDLKKRLVKLHNTDVDPIVKEMIMRILTMKYVPVGGKYCNYLGLSQADFSKISYLDGDRKNRLEGQTTTQHMIKPGTRLITHRKRNYVREGQTAIFKETLLLNNRHLNDMVYPIREFVPTIRRYSVTLYTTNPSGFSRDREIIDGEITVNIPHLEEDSAEFRVLHSRTVARNEVALNQNGIADISTYNLIGIEFENTETILKEIWNYKQRYHTSIGKILRRLFVREFCDNDITMFAEAYSGLITVSNPYYDFSIVDGEQLKWAYHEDNTFAFSNSLGNSCMRYSRCQDYFDMYVKFPDIIKLAILTRSGKVAARCLVWKVENGENGWLYDRIYSTKLETEHLLRSTLEAHNYTKIYNQHCNQITYNMDLSNIDQFPYMDTFSYYFPDDKILANHCINNKARYCEFRSTSGECDLHNHGESDEAPLEECDCCGDQIDNDEVFTATAGQHNGYPLCAGCEIHSENMDASFATSDPSVETYDGDRVLTENSIRLYNGTFAYENDENLAEFENSFGWFIRDINPHYYTDDSCYYAIHDPARQGTLKNMEIVENIVTEERLENLDYLEYAPETTEEMLSDEQEQEIVL